MITLLPTLTTESAAFLAPSRFDVHVVESFQLWLVSHHLDAHLVVDLSAVVFLDLSTVEALTDAMQRRAELHGSLRLTNLSAAARITLEMLGIHERQLATAA
ncbi:MAG: STAS domain-containing protein [Ilumatobacteraceae bacterium]